MKKYIFILNPCAGKRTKVKKLAEDIKRLGKRYPVEIIETQYKGHAKEITEEKAKIFSKSELYIYSCGGDGTLNEVINAAWKYPNVSVGIIPIGSGNDFVRSFEEIDKKDFLNIDKMIKGSTVPVDLIFSGSMASINAVTVGYDCAVAKNMKRFKSFPFINGSMAYKLSVVYCLASKTKNSFTLVADGKTVDIGAENYLLAVAANGRFYGGGFKAAPESGVSDGYIDLISIPSVSRRKFIRLVSKYKRGEHLNNPEMPFVKFCRCKNLKILSDNLIDVNFDGEIVQCKNPELIIKSHAVKIILPMKAVKLTDKEKEYTFKSKRLSPVTIAKTTVENKK